MLISVEHEKNCMILGPESNPDPDGHMLAILNDLNMNACIPAY